MNNQIETEPNKDPIRNRRTNPKSPTFLLLYRTRTRTSVKKGRLTALAGCYQPVVVVDSTVYLDCTKSSERKLGGVFLLSAPGRARSVDRQFTGSAASLTLSVGESSVFLAVVSAFIDSTAKVS
jgi:hypothetical protein